MTALNGSQPVWGSQEHLLADIFSVLVRANSDPRKLSKNFDHPIRAEAAKQRKEAESAALKEVFLAKKRQLGLESP